MRDRPTARLFVAAYPALEVAQPLLESARALPIDPAAYRVVPTEQVHLTLQFIGETALKDVGETLESVERSASGLPAFDLRAVELVTLPRARPGSRARRGEAPRLIAAMTEAPATLVELHRRLAGRLARRPRRDSADRFEPHITLARFAPAARGIDPVAVRLAGGAAAAFRVERIALMRSDLKPTGAVHEAVAWIALHGPGGTVSGG